MSEWLVWQLLFIFVGVIRKQIAHMQWLICMIFGHLIMILQVSL